MPDQREIPDSPEATHPPPTAGDWIRVGHYPTLQEANENGLVILAMGEACRVEQAAVPGEFDLQAEVLPAAKIAGELEEYGKERELAATAALPRHARTYPAGRWICALWILILSAMFAWQNRDPDLTDRLASSSIGMIARGEWWRPFTALFLHADFMHLVGNLLTGSIFATLVARSTGALRGWLMILGCGTIGNTITARLIYPVPFVSLGASTAVFAALGILSGLGFIEMLREKTSMPFARVAGPLLAGLVLLGWLGSGSNGHTDVLGHVFGFATGTVAGAVTGAMEGSRTDANLGTPRETID